MNELENIRKRYSRRTADGISARYDALDPAEYMSAQEKYRALVRWIRSYNLAPLADKRLFEVGCGTGSGLLEFVQLGFSPGNLAAYELIEDRIRIARERVPASVVLRLGTPPKRIFRSAPSTSCISPTVFTSILDDSSKRAWPQRCGGLSGPGVAFSGAILSMTIPETPMSAEYHSTACVGSFLKARCVHGELV